MSDHGYGSTTGTSFTPAPRSTSSPASTSSSPVHVTGSGEQSVSLSDLLALVERRFRLIATTIVLATVGTFAWLGLQEPTYRASATLMLMEDPSAGGLLSELAIMDSTPAASSEMALLRSRSLVEATITGIPSERTSGAVFEPTQPDSVLVGDMRSLGLTTLVQPEDLTPFSTLWAKLIGRNRSPHRLLARASGPLEPRDLEVHFPDADTVRIEDLESGESSLQDYTSGTTLDVFGIQLTLESVGSYPGRTYRVTRPSRADAVDRVLMGLAVHETARNSGVIELTVSDSDPNRAAELANALCQNYILRSIQLGTYRASQTVEFVREQLEAQEAELTRAEQEVVELRAKYPATIDISSAASQLIERTSELELARTRASLAEQALREASRLLAEGDYQAIARLSQELPDLESLVFIQEIGRLTTESLLFERRDSGAFRMLLEQELAKQERTVQVLELELASLGSALEGLARGEAEALLRLENTELVPGEYHTQLAELDAERARLLGTATQDHPDLVRIQRARTQLVARLHELVATAREGVQGKLDDRRELLASYQESLDALPGEERGKVDSAVSTLAGRMGENLRNRIAGLESEQRELDRSITQLEAELGQLPEAERELADPLRRVEAYSEIVQFLLKSKQEAQLSQAATLPSAVLIDPAIPPRHRSSPRMFLSLLVAGILAAAAGLVLAFVIQGLQGCMYTTAELEEATGLPVFGTIPDFRRGRLRIRGAGEGYLPMLHEPGGIIAESYRSIRANLKFALEGDTPLRTLAVTSCAPGEGKTTTNTDLAVAFALGGTKVLIVDADVRRPTVHGYFGLQQSPGFADTIVDDRDWRELVNRTEVETLSVLTAGHYRGTPGEALSSDTVSRLIDEFLSEYDLVVFDLPPAVLVADVEVFAHKLDALVLLYRSGGVPREAFVSAVRRVRASGAKLAGLILNAVQPSRTDSRGYHTYGYGSPEDEKRRKRRRAA